MLEIERIGFWADLKKEFIQATDTQININALKPDTIPERVTTIKGNQA